MSNLWSSGRLVFRGLKPSDDDGLLTQLNSDPESYVQAAPSLAVPPSSASPKSSREFLEKTLMTAIVCLPVEEESKGEDEGDGKTKEPTPIGFVMLSNLRPDMVHHRHCA